ncbi:protein PHLOEM PROTEIN 2-LIKE A9-like protein [Cinnamomum micranthum f. kanehirae]|uniref:Protein PHLOEM PROTEIN 2-LIKE A9-like protein n=1 Tax=Cinnamomum micranthum f. kanehirae TaxID=337451 RepID=A0A3S3NXG6_9MAGN|nr:protein PHLOEM PROTEIN 2-LIKE A9-like protein [Cinnamomum micranthum f. kanehirae]
MASQSHQKGSRDFGKTIIQITGPDGNGFKIKPKALDIIWGGDPRYWKVPDSDDGPAELLQVCWLEVSGWLELSKLAADKTYKVSFKVSMKPDAFGWSGSPVYLMAKVGGNKFIWKSANISGKPPGEEFIIPEDLKFTVKAADLITGDAKLNFGLYEIWRGRWKGGLVIHEVEISPVPGTTP